MPAKLSKNGRYTCSIRSLMLLFLVAACLTWWISAPLSVANRFVKRINAQEYQHAADMFVVDGTAAMLTDWEPKVEAKAWLPKQSPWQHLCAAVTGCRRVELTVTYMRPDNVELPGLFPLKATYGGIHAMPAPIDHNFSGGNDLVMEDK